MSKQVALWLMLGGAAISVYDLVADGAMYGVGKPLEKARWKVYTTSDNKNWYISASDLAALTGAFFYFK